MISNGEIWCPVPGYENLYEVSDHGRVRSLDRVRVQKIARGPDRSRLVARRLKGRIRKLVKMKSGGYSGVFLSDGPNKKHIKVHQLVAEVFIGPKPEGLIPLHGDGNPENCCLGNLRYGTHAENVADAKRHGTFPLGEDRKQAKLDNKAAAAVKALLCEVSMLTRLLPMGARF